MNNRHRWNRIVAVLAVAVVCCTAYALILPAVTMESTCEAEEHTHTEACYEPVLTELSTIPCELEEILGHEHTEACYEAVVALAENEPEEQSEVHQHDAACFAKQKVSEEPICGEEEREAHVHSVEAGCFETVTEVICGLEESEEHTHAEECKSVTETLICTVEDPGHSHNDECYSWQDVQICTEPTEAEPMELDVEAPEETVPERVLICGKEEVILHTHDEGCLDEEGNLICGLEEIIEHQHSEACVQTVEVPVDAEAKTCELEENEEHTHGKLCYGKWNLICELEEHTHTEECTPALKLTAYERKQVETVEEMIDGLPAVEDFETKIAEYEEAEDYEGYETYWVKIATLGRKCYEAYEALSEAQKELVSNKTRLMDLEWLWSAVVLDEFPELKDDSAYVSEIKIDGYDTGTAPFDADDAPGNDSSADNRILRTFDTVTYNFNVKMSTHTGLSYSQARVKMEFVLPLSEDEAEFDQSAMAWMDQTEGYKPVLKTEDRTIDDKVVSCQVLTCYKLLLPSEGHTSVVPGEFGENVTVKVKMMENGRTFAPIISAALVHGAWDGECEIHKIVEKQSVTAETITISAAPKYNVQLKRDGSSTTSNDTFDFSNTGNDLALNKDAGYVPGRIITFGITLQLYNDNASKGLRGIELPTGDITFDVVLKSEFDAKYMSAGTPVVETKDVTKDYLPLVWSYDQNAGGASNQDARQISKYTSYGFVFGGLTPFNKRSDLSRKHDSCFDGGTWRAVQNGNKITFTVSGYRFDGNFPNASAQGGLDANTFYTPATGVQNVGCFSAGELYMIQPFVNSRTGKRVLDDFSEGGEYASEKYSICQSGDFTMTLTDVNLRATSVTGQTLAEVSDNSNQGLLGDDKATATVFLERPGTYQNRNLYSSRGSATMKDVFGIVENQPGTCAKNGNDWAVIGTDLSLTWGGYAITEGENANKMCAGKWLLKFDPKAIELVDGNKESSVCRYYGYRYIYAVKPDGSGWSSNDELLKTNMFALKYYKTIEEAKQHGTIVGIMVEAEPKKGDVEGIPQTVLTTYFSQYAKVREDMSLSNQVFIITEESLIWTERHYTPAVIAAKAADTYSPGAVIPSMADIDASDRTLLPAWTHTTNMPSVYRQKLYNPDGTTKQEHSGSYTVGDSLLVLGFKAKIVKQLEQKQANANGTLSNTLKETYNLDADQRVVDFLLEPSVDYSPGFDPKELTQKTTVTITDILPKHLSYKPGSSYFGGTYVQTSVHGGTQGMIQDGILNEPKVTKNANGTETLVWVIDDVVVGKEMPLIHYSAVIGTKGNEETDVQIGSTNLTNTVMIDATGDVRANTLAYGNYAEEGMVATRGSASAYGKYSKNSVVEPDGKIDYVIYYDNNSTSTIEKLVVLDSMPWNGVNGNNFSGSFTVNSWKVNNSKCDVSKLQLYYTMDTAYAGKAIKEITEAEITNWTKAEIDENGISTGMDGKMPVAWAVIGRLSANQSINIDLQLQLIPGDSDGKNNQYHNMLSVNDSIITTDEYSVLRTLEGLAWWDENADGMQSDDTETENRLSGVKVSLWKLKDGGNAKSIKDYVPCYYAGDSTKQIVIETGQMVSVLSAGAESDVKAYVSETGEAATGRYKFTDLPAGTFAVKFESGSYSFTKYLPSPTNHISNDALDSDAEPVFTEGKAELTETWITGISMPKAAEMSVIKYESKHHDTGFYARGYELPHTGGMGTGLFTGGGLSLMAAAAVLLMKNKKKRDEEDCA